MKDASDEISRRWSRRRSAVWSSKSPWEGKKEDTRSFYLFAASWEKACRPTRQRTTIHTLNNKNTDRSSRSTRCVSIPICVSIYPGIDLYGSMRSSSSDRSASSSSVVEKKREKGKTLSHAQTCQLSYHSQTRLGISHRMHVYRGIYLDTYIAIHTYILLHIGTYVNLI